MLRLPLLLLILYYFTGTLCMISMEVHVTFHGKTTEPISRPGVVQKQSVNSTSSTSNKTNNPSNNNNVLNIDDTKFTVIVQGKDVVEYLTKNIEGDLNENQISTLRYGSRVYTIWGSETYVLDSATWNSKECTLMFEKGFKLFWGTEGDLTKEMYHPAVENWEDGLHTATLSFTVKQLPDNFSPEFAKTMYLKQSDNSLMELAPNGALWMKLTASWTLKYIPFVGMPVTLVLKHKTEDTTRSVQAYELSEPYALGTSIVKEILILREDYPGFLTKSSQLQKIIALEGSSSNSSKVEPVSSGSSKLEHVSSGSSKQEQVSSSSSKQDQVSTNQELETMPVPLPAVTELVQSGSSGHSRKGSSTGLATFVENKRNSRLLTNRAFRSSGNYSGFTGSKLQDYHDSIDPKYEIAVEGRPKLCFDSAVENDKGYTLKFLEMDQCQVRLGVNSVTGFLRDKREGQSLLVWVYDSSHPEALSDYVRSKERTPPTTNLATDDYLYLEYNDTKYNFVQGQVLTGKIELLFSIRIQIPIKIQDKPVVNGILVEKMTSELQTLVVVYVGNEEGRKIFSDSENCWEGNKIFAPKVVLKKLTVEDGGLDYHFLVAEKESFVPDTPREGSSESDRKMSIGADASYVLLTFQYSERRIVTFRLKSPEQETDGLVQRTHVFGVKEFMDVGVLCTDALKPDIVAARELRLDEVSQNPFAVTLSEPARTVPLTGAHTITTFNYRFVRSRYDPEFDQEILTFEKQLILEVPLSEPSRRNKSIAGKSKTTSYNVIPLNKLGATDSESVTFEFDHITTQLLTNEGKTTADMLLPPVKLYKSKDTTFSYPVCDDGSTMVRMYRRKYSVTLHKLGKNSKNTALLQMDVYQIGKHYVSDEKHVVLEFNRDEMEKLKKEYFHQHDETKKTLRLLAKNLTTDVSFEFGENTKLPQRFALTFKTSLTRAERAMQTVSAFKNFFAEVGVSRYPAHKTHPKKEDTRMVNDPRWVTIGKHKIGMMLAPKEGTPEVALLYFHGNGEGVHELCKFGEELVEKLNCKLFLVEYPGYGFSEGTPSFHSIVERGYIAYQYLKGSVFDATPLGIYGRSLGGAVAIKLAEDLGYDSRLNLLIVENSFTNMKLGASAFAFGCYNKKYDGGVIPENALNSEVSISRVHIPTVFLSGANDTFLPPSMMKKLYKSSGATTKIFVSFNGEGHNGMYHHSQYYNVLAHLRNLFSYPPIRPRVLPPTETLKINWNPELEGQTIKNPDAPADGPSTQKIVHFVEILVPADRNRGGGTTDMWYRWEKMHFMR